MARKAKSSFDPNGFLATVNGGRAISEYEKGDVVFAQTEPANAIFYIQKGKVKIAVTSEQGKEAVVAILGTGDFFWRGMLDRATIAPGGSCRDDGMFDHADRQIVDGPRSPRAAVVCREVYDSSTPS